MKVTEIKKDNIEREMNWVKQRNQLIREQLYYLSNIIKQTLNDFEIMNQQIEDLKKKEK
tara:strand:- start:2000 stop:2176 length:177 start_codon:yes stop_codon:yes gene_type:complete